MAVDLDFVHSATKRYAPANASSRLDLSVGATADAESFYVPSTYQVRVRATLICFFIEPTSDCSILIVTCTACSFCGDSHCGRFLY